MPSCSARSISAWSRASSASTIRSNSRASSAISSRPRDVEAARALAAREPLDVVGELPDRAERDQHRHERHAGEQQRHAGEHDGHGVGAVPAGVDLGGELADPPVEQRPRASRPPRRASRPSRRSGLGDRGRALLVALLRAAGRSAATPPGRPSTSSSMRPRWSWVLFRTASSSRLLGEVAAPGSRGPAPRAASPAATRRRSPPCSAGAGERAALGVEQALDVGLDALLVALRSGRPAARAAGSPSVTSAWARATPWYWTIRNTTAESSVVTTTRNASDDAEADGRGHRRLARGNQRQPPPAWNAALPLTSGTRPSAIWTTTGAPVTTRACRWPRSPSRRRCGPRAGGTPAPRRA